MCAPARNIPTERRVGTFDRDDLNIVSRRITSAAALLTAVAGNLYEFRELAAVKLLDIEVPEAAAAQLLARSGERRARGEKRL
ncbi:hypothetical protein [Cryobacterium sp. Y62]|uniref:hypothetical protein n=1 Tax=Cryobacterium sp. Y62 TaxID=2048284 RepID=UPI0011B0B476